MGPYTEILVKMEIPANPVKRAGNMFRRSLATFAGLMESLRGGITSDEGALLMRLASEARDGCIVEVGSFRGKSAVALAIGVRKQEARFRPPIYCIEPHRTYTGYYGGEFTPQDRVAFYEVMLRTHVAEDVALVNLSSEKVTPGWTEPVTLAFFDGDRRYDGVKRDFECWDPHIRQGGIIVFDDATDPDCGPHSLIGEIMQTGRYQRLDGTGKLAVLRKTASAWDTPRQDSYRRQRLLIACHDIPLRGGMLRFNRLGRIWRQWGHDVAWAVLADGPAAQRHTSLTILSLDQAAGMRWDAVMVPGAAFADSSIGKFEIFRQPNFGVRVQHILNDQSRRALFKQMNEAFAPHIVIFNNAHWPVGSFTEFQADRFHFLFGGVDTQLFRPTPYRSHPRTAGKWVVGGLANKNPEPLAEALATLPKTVSLRLFGASEYDLAAKYSGLVEAGRLELTGPLEGEALPRFYREVDCVAMTEANAGWANLVAEAMASGVPVVCTPHGTAAFARDEETALVVRSPTPASLSDRIRRLMTDSALCRRLAERAAETIAAYSWEEYADEMLWLIGHDGRRHYTHASELGLHGKWSPEERLSGLQPLLDRADGLTVIDLGAAEGVVAREFLKHGVTKLHGFDLDADRVRAAERLCAPWACVAFRTADLSDWDKFRTTQSDLLEEYYDIVLYLGLHHHLPAATRRRTLQQLARMARCYFVIRTRAATYEQEGIEKDLAAGGLRLLALGAAASPLPHLGAVLIYQRLGQASAAKPIRQFVSYPKSGRSWIRYMMTTLGLEENIEFHHDTFEFNDRACPAFDFDIARRIRLYSKVDKVVYMTRDPRDLMVSLYFQVSHRFSEIFGYRGSISEFIRDEYFGAANLQRFREMWAEICRRLGFLTVSYEGCHRDAAATLRKILDYYSFDVDPTRLVEAVKQGDFANMKAVEQSGEFPHPWLRLRNGAPKVREGKVGSYRTVFSSPDIDYLNAVFGIDQRGDGIGGPDTTT